MMRPAWILAGAAGIAALGAIARGTTPSPRLFLGTAVAGVILVVIADPAPELASGIAGIAFATSALTSGYDVAEALNRALRLGPTPTTPAGD